VSRISGHVASDRLGDAAHHGGLDFLAEPERRHVQTCDQCRRLYGGYRLTDRLLAAPWREVQVPPALVARASRLAALTDFANGLNPRSIGPAIAAIAIVALIGAALALPRLIPTAPSNGHSPIASGGVSPSTFQSPAGTGLGQGSQSPGAPGSGPGGSGSTSPSGSAPATAEGPAGKETLGVTRIGGSLIAWSPDGAHLLTWSPGFGRQLQIRDASGRVGATVSADAAAWIGSSTVAIATRGSGSTPSAASTATVRRGGSPGQGGFGPGGPGPGHSNNPGGGETVSILDTGGRVVATVPGTYAVGVEPANGMLLGSGNGALTISSPGGGQSGWSFVLWNGSLSAVQDGLPIAFSADGQSLAVLHPFGAGFGAVSGWLEIMAVPSMNAVASFTHVNLRVGDGSSGSAYGFDASFSPNDGYLLAAGTLVNLSNGSTQATGRGGWLAGGTLVTSSGAGLVRWQGARPTVDGRIPGLGTVAVAHHGELVYFYGDGRPPLLLDTDGTLNALTLAGVRSVSGLLISPNGRAIAFDGRATDGSSITAVAALP
jgi:hypothetical protein